VSKLWGGRFNSGPHPDVEAFSRSLEFDRRLLASDLRGSIAHAEMLGVSKILPRTESDQIVAGLESILSDELEDQKNPGRETKIQVDPNAEDIHSWIESELYRRIGSVAGKLHTARSRNDQVTTATRIYLLEESHRLEKEILELVEEIVFRASEQIDSVMPGMTHLQHGQPVSLAHHLLAYGWMLKRDHARLISLCDRVNELPLGSGALAGTTLPIDREWVRKKLGFARLTQNSLDAVSDRDFVIEFLGFASITMMHLSRLCEDLILWSTPEFGFVELSDQVCTGSSLMPQKKNPDVAELVRGRTGRVYGALVGILTLTKALPLSYNRDLQEDKGHLWTGLDSIRACLRLMRLALDGAVFNTDRMRTLSFEGFLNATELADYLVKKGVPFRETHEIAGRAVKCAIECGVPLEGLKIEQLKKIDVRLEADLFEALSPENAMRNRNSVGGTGLESVASQMEQLKSWMREIPVRS
jgi:argininosuccinate lyase